MIEVTKLNNTKISINPFLVESIEETPDTIVVFLSGHKMVVTEKVEVLTEMFQDFLAETIKKGLKKR
jgi:flagellar protein FlbD